MNSSVSELDSVPLKGKIKVKKQLIVEDKIKQTREAVSFSVISLLQSHGFIGHMVQELGIRISDTEVPTAGVSFSGKQFLLHINPDFFLELDKDERKDVLSHEIFHLLLGHLTRGKNYDKMLYNVSADFVINNYLKNLPKRPLKDILKLLPKGAPTPKHLKPDEKGLVDVCLRASNYGLPEGLITEQYYELIQNNEELKKEFEGIGDPSDSGNGSHKKWNEGSVPEHIKKDLLRRMVRRSKSASVQGWGNLPGDIQRSLMEFLEGDVNWKQELKAFLDHATIFFKTYTRKRASRRYGMAFKGKKNNHKLKIAFLCDTSGSIGEEDLSLFGNELNRAFDSKLADIDIISADTEIHDHYSMKGHLDYTNFKLNGGGGTCAKTWLQYLNEKNYDAAVILTDLCFDYNLPKAKLPILWALSLNSMELQEAKNSVKGRVVKLKKDSHG